LNTEYILWRGTYHVVRLWDKVTFTVAFALLYLNLPYA